MHAILASLYIRRFCIQACTPWFHKSSTLPPPPEDISNYSTDVKCETIYPFMYSDPLAIENRFAEGNWLRKSRTPNVHQLTTYCTSVNCHPPSLENSKPCSYRFMTTINNRVYLLCHWWNFLQAVPLHVLSDEYHEPQGNGFPASTNARWWYLDNAQHNTLYRNFSWCGETVRR